MFVSLIAREEIRIEEATAPPHSVWDDVEVREADKYYRFRSLSCCTKPAVDLNQGIGGKSEYLFKLLHATAG